HTETVNLVKEESLWTQENPLLLGDLVGSLTDTVFNLLGGLFSPPMLSSEWPGMGLNGSQQDALNAQIEMLSKLYLEETKVNGFYNVDRAVQLILNGRGAPGEDGYLSSLVKSDFGIPRGI